jgi:signal transduction histidine kinase/DNA-binding response OmpR family regulator
MAGRSERDALGSVERAIDACDDSARVPHRAPGAGAAEHAPVRRVRRLISALACVGIATGGVALGLCAWQLFVLRAERVEIDSIETEVASSQRVLDARMATAGEEIHALFDGHDAPSPSRLDNPLGYLSSAYPDLAASHAFAHAVASVDAALARARGELERSRAWREDWDLHELALAAERTRLARLYEGRAAFHSAADPAALQRLELELGLARLAEARTTADLARCAQAVGNEPEAALIVRQTERRMELVERRAALLTSATQALQGLRGQLDDVSGSLHRLITAKSDAAEHALLAMWWKLCGAGAIAVLLYLFVARSVTRTIEEQVRAAEAATRRAEQARLEAQDASRAKSEFLANISHEIRTPLNGVIGMNLLLVQSDLSREHREYAELARTCGETLLELVNDVLDFSKIEAGRLELEQVEFELEPLLWSAIEVLAQRAREKRLELLARVDPALPRRVVGDPTRLRQVLVNLLGNAIKFTEQGEVVLDATIGPAGDTLEVRVRDTGPGIAEQVRERLFAVFTQADNSTTRRYGGSGLGLAISRSLVERMGGAIGLESELGVGSTFWFRVPLRAAPGALEADAAQPISAGALRGLRVDVVEPHEASRAWLVACLERHGARSVAHASIEAALRAWTSDAPELALCAGPDLDARLPQLRAGGPACLALSSSAQGVHDGAVLLKPLRERALLDALARLHAQAHRSSAGTPAPAAALPASAPSEPAPPHEVPPFTGLRVLVAEDNLVNQRVIRGLLAKFALAPVIANNGREALDALEQGAFDLALFDCQMPVLDGYEAAREWRRREAASGRGRLPILALTANAIQGDRERCLEAGMDDYLTKPVRVDALRAALDRWARATGHAAESA